MCGHGVSRGDIFRLQAVDFRTISNSKYGFRVLKSSSIASIKARAEAASPPAGFTDLSVPRSAGMHDAPAQNAPAEFSSL